MGSISDCPYYNLPDFYTFLIYRICNRLFIFIADFFAPSFVQKVVSNGNIEYRWGIVTACFECKKIFSRDSECKTRIGKVDDERAPEYISLHHMYLFFDHLTLTVEQPQLEGQVPVGRTGRKVVISAGICKSKLILAVILFNAEYFFIFYLEAVYNLLRMMTASKQVPSPFSFFRIFG